MKPDACCVERKFNLPPQNQKVRQNLLNFISIVMFNSFFLAFWAVVVLFKVSCGSEVEIRTNIRVVNRYPEDVSVYIRGAGYGGCDLTVGPGKGNPDDCKCTWGTKHYSLCAYRQGEAPRTTSIDEGGATSLGLTSINVVSREEFTGSVYEGGYDLMGRGLGCPGRKGETLICSDRLNLGNCYDRSYTCNIFVDGYCECVPYNNK